MAIPLSEENQLVREKFTELANEVRYKQLEKLQQRILNNPHPSIEESALGAFYEMYEPHLIPIVKAFIEKGILIEPSSGFDHTKPEEQVLYGNFYFDDKLIRIIENLNIKIKKGSNKKSLKFQPTDPTLASIMTIYSKIVDVFPSHEGDIQISQTADAKKFRRIYVPQDSELKHTRLFEILMYETQEQVVVQLTHRLKTNPHPTQTELNLGAFIEMIEPQVRDAILILNKKGYSTDVSGFMGESDLQIIVGDFSVSDTVREQIKLKGVSISTNNSGYTSIQFNPTEPDMKKIHQKWMDIVSLFPDKNTPAPPSMTVKARQFRKKYS